MGPQHALVFLDMLATRTKHAGNSLSWNATPMPTVQPLKHVSQTNVCLPARPASVAPMQIVGFKITLPLARVDLDTMVILSPTA